jgi:plasmid stabilization system protein ParE
MRVDFHPAALREVEDAQAWYEERSLLAASAFLRGLSVAIQRIQQTPHRYPESEAGTRRLLVERFPFTIHYRATAADTLTIVAVAHQKRRPGYWSGR